MEHLDSMVIQVLWDSLGTYDEYVPRECYTTYLIHLYDPEMMLSTHVNEQTE